MTMGSFFIYGMGNFGTLQEISPNDVLIHFLRLYDFHRTLIVTVTHRNASHYCPSVRTRTIEPTLPAPQSSTRGRHQGRIRGF